jgi:hypothetical protein
MDRHTRPAVVHRAKNRCEYCQIAQPLVPFRPFHVEHIVARQHGGNDDSDNLCLACDRCNAYKGPNLTAIDPITNLVTELFHPRRHTWREHFAFSGPKIIGQTAIGRATARLLNMNDYRRLSLRRELTVLGDPLLRTDDGS